MVKSCSNGLPALGNSFPVLGFTSLGTPLAAPLPSPRLLQPPSHATTQPPPCPSRPPHSLRAASVAECFSLAGFAFYLQAMMMPLLPELSPGPKGAAAAAKAVDITVLGTALRWAACTPWGRAAAGRAAAGRAPSCRAVPHSQHRSPRVPRPRPPCRSTYLVAGFFGAAQYGDSTSSNLLENEWLPGVGTVILNFLVSFYLIISVPPIVFANVFTSE